MKRMRTINALFIIAISLTLFSCSSEPGHSVEQNITVNAASASAAEQLDLQAVGELVKVAKNAEDLENKLNAGGSVNNLDLDEDGDVDYINVQGYGEGAARGFSLYVNLTETETLEVANIEIERDESGDAQVYMTGNEQIYGSGHSYHSHYRASDFLLMAYLFNPSWHPYYHRPYYRGYYPGYYHSYRPVPYSAYSTRTRTITKTSTVNRTSAKNPAPKRKSKISSPNKGKSSSKIKSTLKNPSKSQKSFQAKNPSNKVGTGGFGSKKNTSSSKSSTKGTSGSKSGSSAKKKTTPRKPAPKKKSSRGSSKKSSGGSRR